MQYLLETARAPIDLKHELARGGEGVIFSTGLSSPSVAKIYLRAPDAEKVAKLRAMLEIGDSTLRQVAAWPSDIITDVSRNVRGFLMPRIASNADVHKLYSPKSRASQFPQADFRFLLHVASNICRAFETVHSNGQLIGDVNHGSTLVGSDGRVSLIDVDSFEIRKNGTLYHCDVASPLFTAPELQDVANFRGLARTASQDNFGLAVLIFHLMFMGRHPFAGVPLMPGDLPIERAIKERRFAYSANAARYGVKQPPGTLPLAIFGNEIASHFENAFTSDTRPAATDWLGAVSTLVNTLRSCVKAGNHFYPNFLRQCPWCSLEQATGARLFGYRLSTGQSQIDIASLWNSIVQTARPAEDLALPDAKPWVSKPDFNIPRTAHKIWRRILSGVFCLFALAACTDLPSADGGALVALGLAVAAGVLWPRADPIRLAQANAKLAAARAQWEQLKKMWASQASVSAFDVELNGLKAAYSEWQALPAERSRKLGVLNAQRQEDQKHRYLDQFRIDGGRISGIGSGRAAVLQSWGIETADDITQKVESIPGFGPKLCGELYAWRAMHARNFQFDPNEPLDPKAIDALNAEIYAKQAALLSRLQMGSANLKRMSVEIPTARSRLLPLLEQAWDSVQCAELERKAA